MEKSDLLPQAIIFVESTATTGDMLSILSVFDGDHSRSQSLMSKLALILIYIVII
jgi:hypothetical protein